MRKILAILLISSFASGAHSADKTIKDDLLSTRLSTDLFESKDIIHSPKLSYDIFTPTIEKSPSMSMSIKIKCSKVAKSIKKIATGRGSPLNIPSKIIEELGPNWISIAMASYQ